MSKLNLKLSYKDSCILKHALRNQLNLKRHAYELALKELNKYNEEERKLHESNLKNEIDFVKRYEEEERTYEKITKIIDSYGINKDKNI